MRNLKIRFLVALSAILVYSLVGQTAFADSRMEGSGSKSDDDGHGMMGGPHGQGDKGKGEGYGRGEGSGHGEGYGHEGGHGHHFISHILRQKEKLALTADQVSAIEKLQADYKKQKTDISAEEMAAHKELHKLAHAETVDEAGMRAVADKMSAAETKEIHAMIEAKIAALKILTGDQRKKMKDLHEEMRKKMEEKHEEMKKKKEQK